LLALFASAMLLEVPSANAASGMIVKWTDTADTIGEKAPVGYVLTATLIFDSSGAWTATWEASTANPFHGNARFNLNLFDTALGDVGTATTSQVNLDGFHNFGSSSATLFSYSGTTTFLANWHVGDQVSSGNFTNFLSGAVDMNSPYGRDNLVGLSTIAAVPEPETYAMMMAGLGMIGFIVRRRRTG
jgi:hypothetical protein